MMEKEDATRINAGFTVLPLVVGATQEEPPAAVIPQRSHALQTANARHLTPIQTPIANPPVALAGDDPNIPNKYHGLFIITKSNPSIFSKILCLGVA